MQKWNLVAATLLLAFVSHAEAGTVTYEFTGTVTSADDGSALSFTTGETVQGTFSYDDAATQTGSGAFGASYTQPATPANFQLSNPGGSNPLQFQDASSGTDNLSVFAPNHTDKSFDIAGTTGGGDFFSLTLQTIGSGNFATFSLSEVPPFLATNPSGTLILGDFFDPAIIDISNITLVPEPSSLALAACGLLGLLATGRRRHSQVRRSCTPCMTDWRHRSSIHPNERQSDDNVD